MVGGLEHLDYVPFHIWDVILPIDELIFFKMVKTTNQYIYIYTLRLVVFIFAFWEGKLMLYLSTPQCVWMCIVSPGSFKGAALRGIPEAIYLNTNRRSRLWTPAGLPSVISSWEDYHILVGGLEHDFYDFISYMGCHPSHWLPSGYLT